VQLLHRRDELRASKIMQDRAFKNPKIEFVWNTAVSAVVGNPDKGGVTALVVEDTKTGASREMKVDGLFIAIGHEPNTKLFAGQLDMEERGYILTKDRSTYVGAGRSRAAMRRIRHAARRSPPRVGVHGRDRRRALARSG
jgi:thioredoxin reductase (NADPH)